MQFAAANCIPDLPARRRQTGWPAYLGVRPEPGTAIEMSAVLLTNQVKDSIQAMTEGGKMAVFRKTIGIFWIPIPPLILSALIHMADPDVDGWNGLFSKSVGISVLLLGLFAAGLVGLIVAVFVKFGCVHGLASSLLASACLGFVLLAFGTGATTTAGLIWSFIGCSGLIFVSIFLAAIPAVVLGWSGVEFRRSG